MPRVYTRNAAVLHGGVYLVKHEGDAPLPGPPGLTVCSRGPPGEHSSWNRAVLKSTARCSRANIRNWGYFTIAKASL